MILLSHDRFFSALIGRSPIYVEGLRGSSTAIRVESSQRSVSCVIVLTDFDTFLMGQCTHISHSWLTSMDKRAPSSTDSRQSAVGGRAAKRQSWVRILQHFLLFRESLSRHLQYRYSDSSNAFKNTWRSRMEETSCSNVRPLNSWPPAQKHKIVHSSYKVFLNSRLCFGNAFFSFNQAQYAKHRCVLRDVAM